MTSVGPTATRTGVVETGRLRAALRPQALALLLAVGCGGQGGGDATITQDAYRLFEEGRKHVAAGSFVEARASLDAAVKSGGMQPDFFCEAVALLGRCEAELGNRDAAQAALQTLEQGDPDPTRVAKLRALISRDESAGQPASPQP